MAHPRWSHPPDALVRTRRHEFPITHWGWAPRLRDASPGRLAAKRDVVARWIERWADRHGRQVAGLKAIQGVETGRITFEWLAIDLPKSERVVDPYQITKARAEGRPFYYLELE